MLAANYFHSGGMAPSDISNYDVLWGWLVPTPPYSAHLSEEKIISPDSWPSTWAENLTQLMKSQSNIYVAKILTH